MRNIAKLNECLQMLFLRRKRVTKRK